jgi:RNA polymerase sigma-70 factor, ECF subfamily
LDRETDIEVLYREHGAALVLFATAMLGDRGCAQDVVHRVFAKLLEKGIHGNIVDSKAYLFSCVRNAALNDLKSAARLVELQPETAWFEQSSRDHVAELNLQSALRQLPDDQKQIVVLHIWGELSFLQISEVLAINANTTASRYRYALKKLRELMQAQEKCHANI